MSVNGGSSSSWRKYFKVHFTIGLVSSGYFCNGNLMIWLSKLFFYDCQWLCLEIRFNFAYYCYTVLPFLVMVTATPLFLYKNLKRFNMKWFFYYASFLLIGSWITVSLFVHHLPDVFVCLLLSTNIGIAVATFHFLIPIYCYDLCGREYKLKLDGILASQFATGCLYQYVMNFVCYVDAKCSWLTIAPAIIFLVGICFLPPSPRYLTITGKPHAAKKLLLGHRFNLTTILADVDSWGSRDVFDIGRHLWADDMKYVKLYLPILGLTLLEIAMGPMVILFYLQEICVYISQSWILGSYMAAIVGYSFAFGSCAAYKLHNCHHLRAALGTNYKKLLYVTLSLMAISLFAISGDVHYAKSGGQQMPPLLLAQFQPQQKATGDDDDDGLVADLRKIPASVVALFSIFMVIYAVGVRHPVAVLEDHCIGCPETTALYKAINTTTHWLAMPLLIHLFLLNWRSIGLGWILAYLASLCLATILYVCVFIPDGKSSDGGEADEGVANEEDNDLSAIRAANEGIV